ncbi:hypothetical protein SGLAM104S_00114 [Streptomyces glaucescens]
MSPPEPMTATPPARRTDAPAGVVLSREMGEQPAVLPADPGGRRPGHSPGRPGDRRPRTPLRAAHRPRHLRQRGPLRPVPRGDPSRSALRSHLHVDHHRLRRPVRPHRRPGDHGESVRRLPDLVASTRAARQAGAITLAVTNNPDSPLHGVAEYHLDILAGPEKALPATKTYTASLLALYLFVEGLRGGDGTAAGPPLPGLVQQLLARQDEVRALAGRYRFAERMVITSRGYGYPPAKEAALKLMETSYIPALSYSGADLLHGPLAMVDNVSPVIAVVTEGRGGEALQPVLDRLR